MKFATVVLLALLVVVAGMYLLAKTKKENLGRFFKFISYLVVISGFVVILLVIQFGIIRMVGHCKYKYMGMHHGFNHEMPFPPSYDCKMIKMHNNQELMKMGGDKGCGMVSCCMMKTGEDKLCSMSSNCQLNFLSPEEHAMVITKRISDKVNLTTEQFTKVQALILGISNKKNLLINQTVDPIKLESLLKIQRQESLEAIKKLLTPTQLKLLPEDLLIL